MRAAGKAPGIVYGGTIDPQPIELDQNALMHALENEAFHASILTMKLDGAVSKVLLRDIQMHPWRSAVLHVDFQRVAKDKKRPIHVGLGTDIGAGTSLSILHTLGDDWSIPITQPLAVLLFSGFAVKNQNPRTASITYWVAVDCKVCSSGVCTAPVPSVARTDRTWRPPVAVHG